MSDTTPKAWLCKHCNERVDPTMGICWSCGHDRNGHAPEADESPIQQGMREHCPSCRYDLRGNPETKSCPECGQELLHTANDYLLYGATASSRSSSIGNFFRNPYKVLLAGVAFLIVGSLFLYIAQAQFTQGYGILFESSLVSVGGVILIAAVCLLLFAACALILHGFKAPGQDADVSLVYDNHRFMQNFFRSPIGRLLLILVSLGLVLVFLLGQALL